MSRIRRIGVTEAFRSAGRAELQRRPGEFRQQIQSVFRQAFVRPWLSRLTGWLESNETGFGGSIDQQSQSLATHLGVDRQTARRQLDGRQTLRLDNYLAAVTVFQAEWKQLEVDSRRAAVIGAICETLRFIACEDPLVMTREQEAVELSSDLWELLSRVYQSDAWIDALRIAEDQERQSRLQQVAGKLLAEVQTVHDCPPEIADLTPLKLRQLVEFWLLPWSLFFAAVSFRWRF